MRRKKLWYVPGLYSLLGLPILLLLFGPEDVQEKVALRIFLADDRPPKNEQTIRFTEKSVIDYANTKKLTTIELDADYLAASGKYSAISKLDFINREIQRLVYTRDTSVALRINLRGNSTYGEFVWLVNQMIISDIKRYAMAGNSFYIFRNEIFDEAEFEVLSFPQEYYPLPDYQGPSWWEKFQWQFEYQMEIWLFYIRHNYVLISGLILFILVPFFFRLRKIRRLFPSRQYPLQS